jgi:hypothetical protein
MNEYHRIPRRALPCQVPDRRALEHGTFAELQGAAGLTTSEVVSSISEFVRETGTEKV